MCDWNKGSVLLRKERKEDMYCEFIFALKMKLLFYLQLFFSILIIDFTDIYINFTVKISESGISFS